MNRIALLAAALGFVSVAAPSAAQNIVVNPSFEINDANANAAGWTLMNMYPVNDRAQDGAWSVGTGCVGADCTSTFNSGAYADQVLTTVPGQRYDFSVYIAETAGPTSEYSLFWNGTQVADVVNPANNSGFTPFTVNNLLATSTSTDLQIHGRQDPGGIFFDSVAVVAAATPEPATWALMILGFGMAGYALRRRARPVVLAALA